LKKDLKDGKNINQQTVQIGNALRTMNEGERRTFAEKANIDPSSLREILDKYKGKDITI